MATSPGADPDIRWNFTLPRQLHVEFTEKCKELGISKGGVAKMLIAEWLAGMRNGEERRWRPKKQDGPRRQTTTT